MNDDSIAFNKYFQKIVKLTKSFVYLGIVFLVYRFYVRDGFVGAAQFAVLLASAIFVMWAWDRGLIQDAITTWIEKRKS